MLIRNILEESVRKFDEVKAVKWLNKKEIMERSYGELMENVVSTRKGLLAEGFEGKHIALIGTSSVEWMESYLGIITGCTTAVPLDAALPCEDLIDLLNRSDSVALFLSPKLKPYLDAFLENCPKLQKVWMLQEEVEDAPAKVYGIGAVSYTHLLNGQSWNSGDQLWNPVCRCYLHTSLLWRSAKKKKRQDRSEN